MNDQLMAAIGEFIEAVEARMERQNAEIRSLREEVQTRAAVVAPEPTIEVREGPEGPAGEIGPQGEAGTDGRGVEAVELKGGDLIFRFTDGAEINVGRVAGEPGERGADGVNGRDGAPGEPGPMGERGADGIATVEQLSELIEDRFAEIQVRTLADSWRGVYREGETYRRGNVAQWGGSPWICIAEKQTTAKPGTSSDWQLFAKKGQDAKR